MKTAEAAGADAAAAVQAQIAKLPKLDAGKLAAAPRTMPFGTRLRVTNAENGRTVVVRVNDRGPWVNDRVLDVSQAAAKTLGMVGGGVTKVEIVVLGAE